MAQCLKRETSGRSKRIQELHIARSRVGLETTPMRNEAAGDGLLLRRHKHGIVDDEAERCKWVDEINRVMVKVGFEPTPAYADCDLNAAP